MAGVGRSGSTLLSTLLTAGEGMFAGGEMHRIGERRHVCSCGAEGRECGRWGPVYAAMGDELDAFTAAERRLPSKRLLPWVLTRREQAARLAGRHDDLARYHRLVGRLYEAVFAQVPGAVVVDKSLSPYWLAGLLAWGGADVHVIHLTRDPRGFARSVGRVKVDENSPMFTAGAAWSGRFYAGQHTLTEIVQRRAASHRRLRYEDLVVDPVGVIGELRRWLGLDPACGFEVHDDTVERPDTHLLDANPDRFASGPLRLQVDDAWRRDLSATDRRTVEALTWPLIVRYGYPLRPVGLGS